MTDDDTSFVLKYTNVTTGKKYNIPTNGELGLSAVVMDGYNENLYFSCGDSYYSAWYWGWGNIREYARIYHSRGDTVKFESCHDGNSCGCHGPWLWVQDIEVKDTNRVYSFSSSWSVTEWFVNQYQGADNWGDTYSIGWTYPDQELNGIRIHNKDKFYPNLTLGGALAVDENSDEISVVIVSPSTNIYIFKGTDNGTVWADSLYLASDGLKPHDAEHIDFIYDTTGVSQGYTTIPDDMPKPQAYVSADYDEEGVLHVLYNATYSSTYIDTMNTKGHRSGGYGDTNACYYDGSIHPKPQLLHWDNKNRQISVVTKCQYPEEGESYK